VFLTVLLSFAFAIWTKGDCDAVYVLCPSAAVDSVTTMVVWKCFDLGFVARARFFSDALDSEGNA